jgi:hypothetical protein
MYLNLNLLLSLLSLLTPDPNMNLSQLTCLKCLTIPLKFKDLDLLVDLMGLTDPDVNMENGNVTKMDIESVYGVAGVSNIRALEILNALK